MNRDVNTRAPKPALAIAIAKDALRRLRYRRYAPGRYVAGEFRPAAAFTLFDDARQHLLVIERSCTVCNLGGLLLSKVKQCDAASLHDIGAVPTTGDRVTVANTRDRVAEQLVPIFGDLQLDLLEAFFEGVVIATRSANYVDDNDTLAAIYRLIRAAAASGSRIADPRNRVRVSLRNFIQNDGRLVLC